MRADSFNAFLRVSRCLRVPRLQVLYILVYTSCMSTVKRVLITLPPDLIDAIDKADHNRSGFLARAARRELKRLERKALERSLEQRVGDAELGELEQAGLADWAAQLPEDDTAAMIDESAFEPVRWKPGKGWQKP